MKAIITTLLFAIIGSNLLSQEWAEYYSNEQISVKIASFNYESAIDGIHHERIVFQYTNLTSENLILSFNRNVSYSPDQSFSGNDTAFSISIPANASVAYDLENNKNKAFYLFKSDLKGSIKRSLTKFELSNFQIN